MSSHEKRDSFVLCRAVVLNRGTRLPRGRQEIPEGANTCALCYLRFLNDIGYRPIFLSQVVLKKEKLLRRGREKVKNSGLDLELVFFCPLAWLSHI